MSTPARLDRPVCVRHLVRREAPSIVSVCTHPAGHSRFFRFRVRPPIGSGSQALTNERFDRPPGVATDEGMWNQ